jgi:mRNA-degrading endonuclease RelE of RelBE toxin-antitoxin system
MLDISYAETFLKDLKFLRSTPYYQKIKRVCFVELPSCSSVGEIKNLKKLEGHHDFFRIRVGDYRVGLHIRGSSVHILRVLSRKEIYRFFP